ncbi:MAG: GGDEF domain-containing protein [Betaproteobacteria bacterium]|jgi:diguanylate cyclase (GGDEF)-like protein
MKRASENDIARAGQTQGADAPGGVVESMPHRLRQAIANIRTLERALKASQKQLSAACADAKIYSDTIVQLRQDVIRLEQEVEQVHHFAYHDDLTGLPNRSLLRDRLNQAIIQAAREQKQVGLLLLDLDGFKSINDKLGHAIGDKLLQRVAERLLACVRGADTVCRYGGDEFVILLPEVDGAKTAADVAQKLEVYLAMPYVVDQHSIAVTSSIGVAVYPCDANSQDDLIRRADIAMYLAKAHSNAANRSVRTV